MADQTPLDLTAIQARAAAATPGPWDWSTVIEIPYHGENSEFVAAARTDVPALLAEIIALRTRIAGYESALNFQTTCTGCADYLDQLLDRDAEIQRLRAQVANIKFGAGELEERELAEHRRLRVDVAHWKDRWEAACAREDALAASAVKRHVEIKRLLDRVARLEAQRDAVLALHRPGIKDPASCHECSHLAHPLSVPWPCLTTRALGVTGGEQP